jgi:hypothetical protein
MTPEELCIEQEAMIEELVAQVRDLNQKLVLANAMIAAYERHVGELQGNLVVKDGLLASIRAEVAEMLGMIQSWKTTNHG